MGYIGWNYKALIGRDCSCFPELRLPMGIVIDMRRSVGPGFFYGDLAFSGVGRNRWILGETFARLCALPR